MSVQRGDLTTVAFDLFSMTLSVLLLGDCKEE